MLRKLGINMEQQIVIPLEIWSKFPHGSCRISIKLKRGIVIKNVWVDRHGVLMGQPVAETKDTVFSLGGLSFPENEIIAIKRDNGFLALIGLWRWISV